MTRRTATLPVLLVLGLVSTPATVRAQAAGPGPDPTLEQAPAPAPEQAPEPAPVPAATPVPPPPPVVEPGAAGRPPGAIRCPSDIPDCEGSGVGGLRPPVAYGAGGLAASAAAPDGNGHFLSLTVAPLLLVGDIKVGEVTGELRLGEHGAAAAILGVGSATASTVDGGRTTLTLAEFGGQARWYVLGSFEHGMQLALELLYVYASGNTSEAISATGQGVVVGSYAGYKYVSPFGLTVDAQLGIASTFVTAEASDAAKSARAQQQASDVGPSLRVNLGWSL